MDWLQALNILGLSVTATDEEIRSEWKRLARLYHPDLHNGDLAKAEKFKQITAAYTAIEDLKKKGIPRPGSGRAYKPHPGHGNSDADYFRRAHNGFSRRTSDSYREVRGEDFAETLRRKWGHPRQEAPRSEYSPIGSQNIKLRIVVPVNYHEIKATLGIDNESARMTQTHLKNINQHLSVCPSCKGFGVVCKTAEPSQQLTCPVCGGTGKQKGETNDFPVITAKTSEFGSLKLGRLITGQYIASGFLPQGGSLEWPVEIIWVPVFPSGTWMQGKDLHIRRKTDGKSKFSVRLWHGKKVRVSPPKEVGILGETIRLPGRGIDGGDCYVHLSPLV